MCVFYTASLGSSPDVLSLSLELRCLRHYCRDDNCWHGACKPVMRATGAFRLTVKAGHLCSAGTVAGINMLESHTEIPTLRIQSEPVAGTPTAFTPSQYLTRS